MIPIRCLPNLDCVISFLKCFFSPLVDSVQQLNEKSANSFGRWLHVAFCWSICNRFSDILSSFETKERETTIRDSQQCTEWSESGMTTSCVAVSNRGRDSIGGDKAQLGAARDQSMSGSSQVLTHCASQRHYSTFLSENGTFWFTTTETKSSNAAKMSRENCKLSSKLLFGSHFAIFSTNFKVIFVICLFFSSFQESFGARNWITASQNEK